MMNILLPTFRTSKRTSPKVKSRLCTARLQKEVMQLRSICPQALKKACGTKHDATSQYFSCSNNGFDTKDKYDTLLIFIRVFSRSLLRTCIFTAITNCGL